MCVGDTALVQDQLIRKEKLEAELTKQIEEKGSLQTEVEMMMKELNSRDQQRKLNTETNTKVRSVGRMLRIVSRVVQLESKVVQPTTDGNTEHHLYGRLQYPTTERCVVKGSYLQKFEALGFDF